MEDAEDVSAGAPGPSGRDQQQQHQFGGGAAMPLPFDTQPDEEPLLDAGRSDFELLKRALLNERMAPDILQFRQELVSRIREGLQRKEAELLEMESNREYDLVRQVLSAEADRLRFLLKAYLRARLDKVQKFAGTLLDNGELRARLSAAEARFAQAYFVAVGRSLKASVLDDLPPQYQSLVKRYESEADKRLLESPDTATYVFAQVLTDCGQVPDGDDGQTAEMRAGDMVVVKYRTVEALVRSGQVALL